MRKLLTLILIVAGSAWASAAQVNQTALAQALLTGGSVDSVLAQVRSIGPQNLNAELRGALITRLEQLNQQVEDVTRIDRTVDTFVAPETLAELSRVVAQLRDPRAISALTKAIYGGPFAIRALVEFGAQALPAVTNVVMWPSSHYTEVEHCLMTMRVMVERGNVSPAGLAQIRAAAKFRLTGEQYFTALWQAIDLAAVVNDPELNSILNDLATHPSESHRRGVTNQEVPDLVEKTQKRATDRLAGVPPRPSAESLFALPAPEP